MRLSKYAKRLTGQPMFQLLDQVKKLESKGKNIVHFEIGDPDFSTPFIPLNNCIASLLKGETHYAPSAGIIELREEIAVYHSKLNNLEKPLTAANVVIAPGCNPLIYCIMQCLMNPGDTVSLPQFIFPTYRSIMKLLNLKEVDENGRIYIINSPNNPTGEVLSEMQLLMKYAMNRKSFIISDEIYNLISYGRQPAASILKVDPELKRSCIVSGYSKAFSMTGWRIGYMIGPEWLCAKVALMLQSTVSCTNTFVQKACVGLLTNIPNEVHQNIKELRARRNRLYVGLNKIKNFELIYPEGAFYVFARITGTNKKPEQICEILLRHGVAALPGTSFGKTSDCYVRFAYCISIDEIEKGIQRIKRAAKKF